MSERENGMTDFQLTYDGPSVADGSMPVRDLAPALLALGQLFQEASAVVDPTGPQVSLEVKAFDRGSFGVDLHVVREAADLFSRPGVQQMGLLIGLIADSSHGLFAFLRWLRSRSISSRRDQDDGSVSIEDNEGNVFIMPNGVVNIYESPRARALARDVVKPLKTPGIDEMRVERPNAPTLRIRDEELEAFEAPIPEDVLVDQQLTMFVAILDAVFARGHKWKFSAGDIQTLWAAIDDEAFWDRVEARGDLFGFGDVLEVRMGMKQARNSRGELNTTWTILEVLDHKPGGGGLTPTLWSIEVDDPEEDDS
jgi:hypothetical protein